MARGSTVRASRRGRGRGATGREGATIPQGGATQPRGAPRAAAAAASAKSSGLAVFEGSGNLVIKNTFITIEHIFDVHDSPTDETPLRRRSKSCPPGKLMYHFVEEAHHGHSWGQAALPAALEGGALEKDSDEASSTSEVSGTSPEGTDIAADDDDEAMGDMEYPFQEGTLEEGMLPSRGSRLHALGGCTPCLYGAAGICKNGSDCGFCHFSHSTMKWKRPRPPKFVRNRLKRQQPAQLPQEPQEPQTQEAQEPIAPPRSPSMMAMAPQTNVGVQVPYYMMFIVPGV